MRITALLLLALALPSLAAWQADQQLTTNSSASYMTDNNAWCVAASGDTVHIVFCDNREGGDEIYYTRSTNGGASWVSEIPLTTDDNLDSYQPSIAVAGTVVHVVWRDNRISGNSEIWYRRSTNAGTSWGSETRLTNYSQASTGPCVAVAGTGVYVAWHDYRHSSLYPEVYFKRSSDCGATWGLDERLTYGGNHWFGTASVAVSGDLAHVVWRDSFGQELRYKRSTDAGANWQTDTQLSDNDGKKSARSCVAVAGNVVHVVWHDVRDGDWEIYYKCSTNGGASWGSDTRLTNAQNSSTYPSAAADGNNVHVVWQDYRDGNFEIYYKRSTDGGASWGSDTRLTNSSDTSNSASVAVSGTAVHVVWRDERNGNWDVYYKRDPTGNPLPAADVGVDSIIRPVASFITANSRKIPPMARIKNHGSQDQGSFDIRFSITPGTYSSTRTVSSLAAGATCEVEFDSLTLTVGAFTARCSTMLSGDEFPDNNRTTACFQGCDFINFSDLTSGDFTPSPSEDHWTRGAPQNPWTLPPMDDEVWGYRLSGTYDNSEAVTLTSPTYRATQADPSIAFQHSYMTETYGDGGNLSYTTDNGSNWNVATPSAGPPYFGTISALSQAGWCGGPSGWNQSVFTIPVSADATFGLRWRFAANATISSNGWLIDEVAGINCGLATDEGRPRQGIGSLIDTMSVAPNPVHGDGQLSYALARDCEVSIKLYDAAGRLAGRPSTSGFKKGVNTTKLDATRLAPGVYFVKLTGDGDVATTKVIIE